MSIKVTQKTGKQITVSVETDKVSIDETQSSKKISVTAIINKIEVTKETALRRPVDQDDVHNNGYCLTAEQINATIINPADISDYTAALDTGIK